MKVLVTGSRHWDDAYAVWTALDGLYAQHRDDLTIIEGGARGADYYARVFPDRKNVRPALLTFPADWDAHGKAAGHIRNQQMLDEGPDLVLAFKDDLDPELRKGGTEDMIRRAKKAGVPVYHIRRV